MRLTASIAALALLFAACTSTTPTTTEALITTTAAPTTTDTRIGAVEARLAELNIVRLQAHFDGDADLLRTVHGNQTFLTSDLATLESRRMGLRSRPDPNEITYEVIDLLLDREDCIVAATRIDLTSVFGTNEAEDQIEVMWASGDAAPLLAGILPADAPEDEWLEICDDTPRGLEP